MSNAKWTMTNKEKWQEKCLVENFRQKYCVKKPVQTGKKQKVNRIKRYKSQEDVGNYWYWRKCVLQRDGYKCVQCGSVGGKLHAHHILEYAYNKELQFEIPNGITLCVDCHENLHHRIISLAKYPPDFHRLKIV